MDDILEGAPCGFLSFGDDGIVTLVNQYLLDILGQCNGAVAFAFGMAGSPALIKPEGDRRALYVLMPMRV